jgi:hypothetical protein
MIRCPNAVLSREPEVIEALDAYAHLRRQFSSGVWPNAGGLLDQSASFLEAVRILDAEFAVLATEEKPSGDARGAGRRPALP